MNTPSHKRYIRAQADVAVVVVVAAAAVVVPVVAAAVVLPLEECPAVVEVFAGVVVDFVRFVVVGEVSHVDKWQKYLEISKCLKLSKFLKI